MKKINYIMALVLLISLAYSCKKDEEVNTKTTGSASVSGTLKANLDQTNDTTLNGTPQIQYENVPQGTVITFVVDSKDLESNPDTSYNYAKLQYSTSVASNGAFSVALPANANVINAEVRFSDFQYNVIVGFNGSTPIVNNHIFTKPIDNITIYNSAVVIKQYTY